MNVKVRPPRPNITVAAGPGIALAMIVWTIAFVVYVAFIK